ncbi:MAG: Lrp/AsnC family transcriptional regulator [Gammaproteobacteria bacterium]|nr:MAG: Lrp/AsnC family transcriptional regulator [Gammaproteobacteria bacterium]
MAAQAGLPLQTRPYHWLADELGVDAETLMQRLRVMQADGRIRRIGVVPNHYRLGYTANAMTVWDVADEDIREVGRRVGELDIVSHCYHRPRRLPDWPYNLFAMVHGRSREEVKAKVQQIAQLLGDRVRGYDVLFSTRILKKTGLRLAGG